MHENQWTGSENGSTLCRKLSTVFKATFQSVFGSNSLYKLKHHHKAEIEIYLVYDIFVFFVVEVESSF